MADQQTPDYPGAVHTVIPATDYANTPLGSSALTHSEAVEKMSKEINEVQKKLGIGESDASDASAGQVPTKQSDGTTSWETPGASDTANAINGATAKTTPVDADYVPITDSAASFALKKVTWANVKATLKSYFDTLYAAITHTHAQSDITNLTTDLAAKEAVANKDTDTGLAANSDTKYPSQKAVKAYVDTNAVYVGGDEMSGSLVMGGNTVYGLATPSANDHAANKQYVDTAVTGLLDFKGSTDASANPNYPSASKGDAYVVSVAGKVGGASGKSVDVGDVYVAIADNAGGTEASVGTSWIVLEHNLQGALLSANNLSDLANAETARTNLGLGIGVNVQAFDAQLTDVATISPAKGKVLYTDATNILALAAGTDGHVLTADSAQTAGIKWAAGGGSTSVRYQIPLITPPWTTTTPDATVITTGATGAGASVSVHNPRGLNMLTGSTNTGGSWAYFHSGSTSNRLTATAFDNSPRMFFHVSTLGDNGDHKWFMGMGALHASFGDAGASRKVVGFRLIRDAAASVIYAVVGSGSAETATNVTSSLDGFAANDFNKPTLFWIDMTSGTNVKFYHNKTLLATITTNLPSGALTTENEFFGMFITNNSDGTSTNALYTKNAYMEINVA